MSLTQKINVVSSFAKVGERISELFNSFINNGIKACKEVPSLAGRVVSSFNALPLCTRVCIRVGLGVGLVSALFFTYFVLRPLLQMAYGKIGETYCRYQVGCSSSHDPLIRLQNEGFSDGNRRIRGEKRAKKIKYSLLALHYLDIYEGAYRKGVFSLFSKSLPQPYVLKGLDGRLVRNSNRTLSGMHLEEPDDQGFSSEEGESFSRVFQEPSGGVANDGYEDTSSSGDSSNEDAINDADLLQRPEGASGGAANGSADLQGASGEVANGSADLQGASGEVANDGYEDTSSSGDSSNEDAINDADLLQRPEGASGGAANGSADLQGASGEVANDGYEDTSSSGDSSYEDAINDADLLQRPEGNAVREGAAWMLLKVKGALRVPVKVLAGARSLFESKQEEPEVTLKEKPKRWQAKTKRKKHHHSHWVS